MKIFRITGDKLLPKVKLFRKMTLSDSSMMSMALDQIERNSIFRMKVIAFLAIDNGIHHGWSLLTYDGGYYPNIMVFVNEQFRKKGIATKLINKALKYSKKKPTVRVWDLRSDRFWKSFNDKVTVTGYVFC